MVFIDTTRTRLEFIKFAEVYASLIEGVHFTLQPTNIITERKKFFASSSYNPQFTYKKYSSTHILDDIEHFLGTVMKECSDSAVIDYFIEQISFLSKYIKLALAMGSKEFSMRAKDLYGWQIPTDNEYLGWLTLTEEENELLDAPKIKSLFEMFLAPKNIYDWQIVISPSRPKSVRVTSKCIYIGSEMKRSEQDVKRLIVHEIQTHIYRRVNSRKMISLFQIAAVKDYILYEEGLAVFNEFKSNTITSRARKNYALRLEVAKLIHLSFRELYNFLLDFLDEQDAFDLVFKFKRGLGDTSEPGGYLKDIAYLAGYTLVKDLTYEQIRMLYVGKISANEFQFLDDSDVTELLLPDFF